jgi:hypothetical protein
MPEAAIKAGNPYPGLRPFELEDADHFFGRDDELYELLQRLRTVRFLAVLGPSGSGKSSLIKAGLISALQDGYQAAGGWKICMLRPGRGPLNELTVALARGLFTNGQSPSHLDQTVRDTSLGIVEAVRLSNLPDRAKVLILVDQFEELFQFVNRSSGREGQEEAKAFLKLLLTASACKDVPIHVVITMRSEWLGRCAQYPNLAAAINEGFYLVPQMTRQQLRDAIVNPAVDAGGEISDTLIDLLLNDAAGQSDRSHGQPQTDQLPLLQHAMQRMWESEPDAVSLNADDYRRQHSLLECLERHVEEAYAALTEPQQKLAKSLFTTITELTPANRKVRRPSTLQEICGNAGVSLPEMRPVIEPFAAEGRSFLTVNGDLSDAGTIVDISHEALIRQWRRLGDWVEEEGEIRKTLRRLNETALLWEQEGRNEAFLYRGAQLQTVHELPRPRVQGVPAIEKSFLAASDKAVKASQVRRVWMLSTIAVVVLGAAVWLAWQKAQLQQTKEELERTRTNLIAALNDTQSALDKSRPQYSSRPINATAIEKLAKANPAKRFEVSILYYAKKQESDKTDDLLSNWKNLGFNARLVDPKYDPPSNCMWYGSGVSVDTIRLVALTILRAGVPLRRIIPFANDKDQERVIKIGWSGKATEKVKTYEDVAQFKK